MSEVVLADLRFHAAMRGCDAVHAAEEALAGLLEDDGGLRGIRVGGDGRGQVLEHSLDGVDGGVLLGARDVGHHNFRVNAGLGAALAAGRLLGEAVDAGLDVSGVGGREGDVDAVLAEM